jgi:hypothetical protein
MELLASSASSSFWCSLDPERLRSEAAWAHLCAAAPIPPVPLEYTIE